MKLVRDRIAEYVYAQRQEHLNVRYADQSEMLDLFKRKLMEEASEVMQADTQSHMAEELADVLEVVEGFIEYYGLKDQVEKLKAEKAEARGGFKNGVVLE